MFPSVVARFKLDFLGLIFIIWACPKWTGPNKNKLNLSKMTGTQPNNLDSPKSFWTHTRTRHKKSTVYSKLLLKTLAWNFHDESTQYFNRRSTLWSFESKSQGPVNCGQFWWMFSKYYDAHSAIWFDFIKLFVISFEFLLFLTRSYKSNCIVASHKETITHISWIAKYNSDHCEGGQKYYIIHYQKSLTLLWNCFQVAYLPMFSLLL